jgi:hypothetical protein
MVIPVRQIVCPFILSVTPIDWGRAERTRTRS